MNLTDLIFHDADKAREHLEKTRWPNGPVCPHCGVVNEATYVGGKAARKGVYQCNACREQFTATVGTVMESSKVPLNKWLLATYLMSSSKKGVSAHQLHRSLDVTEPFGSGALPLRRQRCWRPAPSRCWRCGDSRGSIRLGIPRTRRSGSCSGASWPPGSAWSE